MTYHPPGHPDEGTDMRLVRVLCMLPKWLVVELDRRTTPGYSRSAVMRELLTDAVKVAA